MLFGGQSFAGTGTGTASQTAPFGQGLNSFPVSSSFAPASSQSVPFSFGSVSTGQTAGMGMGMGMGMGIGMGASMPGDMNSIMGGQGQGQGQGAFSLDTSATGGAARRKLKARGAGGSRR